MVKVHHLQLRCSPPLLHNLKLFNILAATVHDPDTQKEVDGLLSKGAIEPLTGSASFYSNVVVVPKCTGGLQLILNIKQFICYMCYQVLES